MKLHEPLPDAVTVDGKRYKVDFDFRKILKSFDIMNDETILPESRINAVLRLLVGKRCRDNPRVVQAIFDTIKGDSKSTGTPVFDFTQDAGEIYAGFRQAYGIDLFTERLTWFEFIELFSCLPENTRMAQIISIRAKKMPAPTRYNQAERANLMKLKNAYALHGKRGSFESDLKQLADTLLSMAKG